MITNEMLNNLKNNVAELAGVLNCSMDAAFDAAVMPDWLWSEMAAARDAAGPRPEMSLHLLAVESPERESASAAVLARVREHVCA